MALCRWSHGLALAWLLGLAVASESAAGGEPSGLLSDGTVAQDAAHGERWRLTKYQLRSAFNMHESSSVEEAHFFLEPSKLEKQMLGEELFKRRRAEMRAAHHGNRRFLESILVDLPDSLDAPPMKVLRPLVEFRVVDADAPTLHETNYGSISALFLHLCRDWSIDAKHVHDGIHARAIAELRRLLPQGGNVLVPGAGLGRLAANIAVEGFKVEANEGSRLFLTVADWILNRAIAPGVKLYPFAHLFPENFGFQAQYRQISVPNPVPAEWVGSAGASGNLTYVPGDFVKIYQKGGMGHRKFDAIVTCFFIDTMTDIMKLAQILDSLLDDGGVWVNVGPLNYPPKTRLQLNWEEMTVLWTRLGYEFVLQDRMACDYTLQRGDKMFTESYHCAFSSAIKRKRDQSTEL